MATASLPIKIYSVWCGVQICLSEKARSNIRKGPFDTFDKFLSNIYKTRNKIQCPYSKIFSNSTLRVLFRNEFTLS